MVEINLLPWRELERANKTKLKIFCVCLVVIVITVILFTRHKNFSPPVVEQDTHTLQLIKKIKFIGFLQQNQRIWAILRLPNGKIQEAQTGTTLMEKINVTSIDSTAIILTSASDPALRITLPLKHH
jgi:hypothetical protein